MTAQIIPFPGLLERVAHRLVLVMEVPTEEQRDDAFGEATTELGIGGFEGGLVLSPEQWAIVWRRVEQLMTEGKRANG